MSLQCRQEHWTEIGELTGCGDLVASSERLGEVHWGDHGYDACVLHVLTAMMERCPEKLDELEGYVESLCDGVEEHGLSLATLVRL